MAKIKTKRLTLEDLQNRAEYLEECLGREEDVLKRLDLIQAQINVSLMISEYQNPPRKRTR